MKSVVIQCMISKPSTIKGSSCIEFRSLLMALVQSARIWQIRVTARGQGSCQKGISLQEPTETKTGESTDRSYRLILKFKVVHTMSTVETAFKSGSNSRGPVIPQVLRLPIRDLRLGISKVQRPLMPQANKDSAEEGVEASI